MEALRDISRPDIHVLREEILSAGRVIVASKDLTPANSHFHNARYRLYRLAGVPLDGQTVSDFQADPEIQSLASKVFPVSCEAGVYEECAIARRLLSEPALTFGKIYRRYYGNVYDVLMADELRWLRAMSGIQIANERIAYVGGGAMPVPAMLLAQRHGCRVTIFDPHAESCDLARQLIARAGLAHLVDVVEQAGQEADYRGFSIVWIANWIEEKSSIFSRIHAYTNVQFVIARSAAGNSLSFIINDEVDHCSLCTVGFDLLHTTARRADISLVSLIFRNLPCVEELRRLPAEEPVRRRIVNSMTDLIGNMPMLRLDPDKTGLKNIELYAKLEHLNPFGSIKDRTAYGMIGPHIRDIAAQGKTVLEMSSGNAARGLQAIASIHGAGMETITGRIRVEEMRKILKLQGARLSSIDNLVDTSSAYGTLDFVDNKAMQEKDRYFYTDQYRNPANDGTHYSTTGREIMEDLGVVDYIIGSVGTAGSTVGVARGLKEANENIGVIGVVSDGEDFIPGIRHKGEIFDVGAFDENFYEEIQAVSAQDAIDGVLDLIRLYGVMAGPSSGAAYKAALDYLRKIDASLTSPRKAVFIVCDRVELYLSYIEARRPDIFAG